MNLAKFTEIKNNEIAPRKNCDKQKDENIKAYKLLVLSFLFSSFLGKSIINKLKNNDEKENILFQKNKQTFKINIYSNSNFKELI